MHNYKSLLYLSLLFFLISLSRVVFSASLEDTSQVVSPGFRVTPLLGLGIIDAWVTRNSYLISPRYGYQFVMGGMVDRVVKQDLSISLGVLRVPRQITVNDQGALVARTRSTLVLPMVGKYSLFPLVSVMVGGSLAVAIGDWHYEREEESPSSPRTEDLHSLDFGLFLGLEFKYPIQYSSKYRLDWTTEIFYYYGISNMSRDRHEDFRYRETYLLSGLTFGF